MLGGAGSESFNTADSTLPKARESAKTMLASAVQSMTGFTGGRSFAAATAVDIIIAMHANNTVARTLRKVSEPLTDLDRLRILDLSRVSTSRCLIHIALFNIGSNLKI
jgi:hypothetical protein